MQTKTRCFGCSFDCLTVLDDFSKTSSCFQIWLKFPIPSCWVLTPRFPNVLASFSFGLEQSVQSKQFNSILVGKSVTSWSIETSGGFVVFRWGYIEAVFGSAWSSNMVSRQQLYESIRCSSDVTGMTRPRFFCRLRRVQYMCTKPYRFRQHLPLENLPDARKAVTLIQPDWVSVKGRFWMWWLYRNWLVQRFVTEVIYVAFITVGAAMSVWCGWVTKHNFDNSGVKLGLPVKPKLRSNGTDDRERPCLPCTLNLN